MKQLYTFGYYGYYQGEREYEVFTTAAESLAEAKAKASRVGIWDYKDIEIKDIPADQKDRKNWC